MVNRQGRKENTTRTATKNSVSIRLLAFSSIRFIRGMKKNIPTYAVMNQY